MITGRSIETKMKSKLSKHLLLKFKDLLVQILEIKLLKSYIGLCKKLQHLNLTSCNYLAQGKFGLYMFVQVTKAIILIVYSSVIICEGIYQRSLRLCTGCG